jgi:hypothetical protein
MTDTHSELDLDLDLDLELDLDTSWVKQFEELDKEYSAFYKEKVEHVTAFIIYVNASNETESIRKDILILDNGVIRQNAILQIVNDNKQNNGIGYKLISIFKYNISLNPENLQDYLRDKLDEEELNSYFTNVSALDDIRFNDTISILQDINSIYFVFYEKEREKKLERDKDKRGKHTKRIHFNLGKHTKSKTKKRFV